MSLNYMNINYLLPVFGSPLLAVVQSRRLIKMYQVFTSLLISGIIFNGVRSTKNLCAARACSSYQTTLITRIGASKIPCNDAENSTQCHGESVEGHDTWNDSHVETSGTLSKKVKFPDFL